jgi:hypothetical protein
MPLSGSLRRRPTGDRHPAAGAKMAWLLSFRDFIRSAPLAHQRGYGQGYGALHAHGFRLGLGVFRAEAPLDGRR